MVLRIVCQINSGHPAAADFAHNAIAVGQSRRQGL